jgi:hypothetical protein
MHTDLTQAADELAKYMDYGNPAGLNDALSRAAALLRQQADAAQGHVVPAEQKASLMRAAVVLRGAAKQLSSSEDCSGLPARLVAEADVIARARYAPPDAGNGEAAANQGEDAAVAPTALTEREALDLAIACGRGDKMKFRIPGTSDSHEVECAVLGASDALQLVRQIAQRLAAVPQPAQPLLKKFFELPKGTRFRYPGSKRTWVVLERHGCGLVAGYEPHDGALAGQSICAFANSEEECRAMEVEVVEDSLSLHGPVELELPDGDTREVKVFWAGVRDGKRHLCISVEPREQPGAPCAAPAAAAPYAYALEFPGGQVALLKDDPASLRQASWAAQGVRVHELTLRAG